MTSTARRYSLANPPPTQGDLDGRETSNEAEILEVQALQAEHDGDGGRSIQLMERALQIRCHVVNQLRERWANAPEAVPAPLAASGRSHRMSTVSVGPMSKDDVLREYHAQCSDLYDAAERLVVSCNACGVEHFKKDAFAEATPLLEYAMQLTEEEAYPLCEAEERRRHLRGVTLNNLGCMERRRGHFSEALQYMKASVEMTGVESPVAYMNMSAILIQLRLNDEAVRMAERSIALLAQTPEDPSLLAVAHHNLAMALEPVDPQRCVEEYDLAYRVACATQGKDSATSQSIQHSWQRFERTRAPAPPPGSRVFPSRGGPSNPRQHHTASLPPPRNTATPPGGAHAASAPAPADAAEIFPHPFLLTASGPRRPHAPGHAAKSPAMLHRPIAASRTPREATPEKTFHRPSPPPATQPSAKAAAAALRTMGRGGRNDEGSEHVDGRLNGGFAPSPPSQRAAAASRRFSPSRTTDSTSSRPTAPQRRLSEQGGGVKKAKGSSRLSPLRITTTTATVAARSTTSSTEASAASAKPSRVPRRPAERGSRAGASPSTSLPPPRVLPPLQTAEHEHGASTERRATRASRDATTRASLSQHRPLAADATMDDNPLAFLQSRLDVLLQDEEELEQKYMHANTIQRLYRGHLARKRAAGLRALRDRDARLAQLRQHTAARQIQQAYRRHRRQRRYPFASGRSNRYAGGRRSAQHQAATQVQRIARGWLARRRYAKLRQFARDSPAAAARIQRWYRGVHAQRRHATLLAEKAQQEQEMRAQEQQHYAATCIQGQWRAFSKRRAYETDLHNRMMARAAQEAEKRMASAVRIQSVWRGSRARKLYRNTFSRSSQLRAARQEYEQRRQAALKLQSFGRMIIAQNQSHPLLTAARLRAANDINTRSREGRAAQIIQCAYRSHKARRTYAARKTARDAGMRNGFLQTHTTTIQRVGRGYAARRLVGAELAALQNEAQRYERRLHELERGDAAAARVQHQNLSEAASSLQRLEGKERNAMSAEEKQARRTLQHHCEIATENVSAQVREKQALRAAAIPALTNFARIVKAKQQRARRQSARDAYLAQCGAAEEAAHEDASARKVTAFVRTAGARNAVRSRADAVRAYNDARTEQEAEAESEASELADSANDAPAATADTREPSKSGPRRPLTAQQIAQERAMLDRLAAIVDAELTDGAIDAPAASADTREPSKSEPRRPLTAQQIAQERAMLDRLAVTEDAEGQSESLTKVSDTPIDDDAMATTEEELLAQQKAVWQAEEKANKQRRLEQEALHRAMFDYKQERIAAAEGEEDLVQYTKERVRLQKPTATGAAPFNSKASRAVAELETAQNIHRQQRAAQERSAVRVIEQHYLGCKARQHFAALQRVRDEYLAAQQDAEKHEGPQLVSDRLREVTGQHPGMVTYQRKHISFAPVEKSPTPSSNASPFSSSPKALEGFARIVKAKQQRARRQSARDAYLAQCGAAEEAAHEDASARKVTAFVRTAGARNAVRSRADAVRAYNDARTEQEAEAESEASELADSANDAPAATADTREPSKSGPRRPLTAQQIAQERAMLDRLEATEDVEVHSEVGRPMTEESNGALNQLQPSPLERNAEEVSVSDDSSLSTPAPRERRRLTRAEACECLRGFAQGVQDRKELRRRQASRDAYLQQHNNSTREDDSDDVDEGTPATPPTPNAEGKSATFVDHDGIRDIYRQEREAVASNILSGLPRIVKAKQQRARRQSARDAYLAQCGAAEEAAHEDASARKVTAFVRTAGARNAVQSRADAVRAYNDARTEQEAEAESEAAELADSANEAPAATADTREPSKSGPRRPLTAQQIAQERAMLDRLAATEDVESQEQEEMAVEELLHRAALAIQCVYRGHRARKQAAMAIVRRDLYLLSLHAQEDEATANSSSPLDPFAFDDELDVDAASPLSGSRDNETTSTAVVMPVNEEEEEALQRMLR